MHCLGLGHTGYLFYSNFPLTGVMMSTVTTIGTCLRDPCAWGARGEAGPGRSPDTPFLGLGQLSRSQRAKWVNRQKKDLDIVRKDIEEKEMLSSQGRMNQQCETQAAKEEHTIVPTLTILCWLVYLVLHVEQLSIYCISLKKEVFASNIKLHKATMELNMTKDDMKAVQNDLTNADRDYRKIKKVVIVQKTLSTLTHTNEALSRLVFESPAPVELKPPHLHQPPNSEDIALNMTFDIITPDPMYKRLSQVPSKKMHLDPAVVHGIEEVPMDTSFHNTNLFRKRTFGSMLDPKRIKLGAPSLLSEICPLMKAKRGKKGSRPAPPKSSTCPTLNSFLE
uniref:Uncharacterized protein n=1 Tax=Oncorhynchus kisutch TaxID=8019 RepID=A0A8C7FRD2_ONCKI